MWYTLKDKHKKQQLKDFIAAETGVQISEYLNTMLCQPNRLEKTNNADLERIVREFSTIYRCFRSVLDGTEEVRTIELFALRLQLRIQNKPDLMNLLTESPNE